MPNVQKGRPMDKQYPEKQVFDNRKNGFSVLSVGKPTDFIQDLATVGVFVAAFGGFL
jgi:hypothetical protein